MPFILLAVLLLGLIIAIIVLLSPEKTPETKRYGNIGERKAYEILERSLPEGYIILQNVFVTYGDRTSEIDFVVVGKTGVFVIEVKNMKGKVIGDYSDKNWLHKKIDQYDIEHQDTFYSPVKQIGTHIFRLKNYLRDNKVFTHISGAVYFVNPKSKVSVSGEPNDIPIYTYKSTHAMLNYITSGTANLSDSTIQKIIQLLK